MKVQEIDFTVSLHPSKFSGHWNVNKAKEIKHITLFVSTQWRRCFPDKEVGEYGITDVDNFIRWLIETIIIETICIERANQGLKIKNRCKPCHVSPITYKMLYGE